MLSKTYQTIGGLFPATYAANGYYTIIFGGVNLEKYYFVISYCIGYTISSSDDFSHKRNGKGEEAL